jgi:translation initiation factor 1 (eIF-1/SUI1)
MGRGQDGTRIPTDGASRQGHGTSLGDLLRARGLVPAGAGPGEPGAAPDSGTPGTDADAGADAGDGAAASARVGEGLPAFPARVVLRRERKGRGGRMVTRVQGLGWDDAALADLARTMARALGCGAGVEDGDVVLQGDAGERAAAWLAGRGVRRVVR